VTSFAVSWLPTWGVIDAKLLGLRKRRALMIVTVLFTVALPVIFYGIRLAFHLPPMPTWAMITVIVGWIVGWSAIGAWKMATRDA
jgi:hypothetical protein